MKLSLAASLFLTFLLTLGGAASHAQAPSVGSGTPTAAAPGPLLGARTVSADGADQLAAYLTLKAFAAKPAPLHGLKTLRPGTSALNAGSGPLRSGSIDAPAPPPPAMRDAVASRPAESGRAATRGASSFIKLAALVAGLLGALAAGAAAVLR